MITFWEALIRGLKIEQDEEDMFKFNGSITRIRDYSVNVNRLSSKRQYNNYINGKDFREKSLQNPTIQLKPKEQ
jgi:hypothetical protein|tara:strand:+ start:7729 stop:7950 length:222 start_codon:yes stop_codon:yes gene_type:complete